MPIVQLSNTIFKGGKEIVSLAQLMTVEEIQVVKRGQYKEITL